VVHSSQYKYTFDGVKSHEVQQEMDVKVKVSNHSQHPVLFFSRPQYDYPSLRGLATPWTYFLHLSLSCVILIDSSTDSPVLSTY